MLLLQLASLLPHGRSPLNWIRLKMPLANESRATVDQHDLYLSWKIVFLDSLQFNRAVDRVMGRQILKICQPNWAPNPCPVLLFLFLLLGGLS